MDTAQVQKLMAAQENNDPARLKCSIWQTELMQPTIIAISMTYIIYTVSAHFSMVPSMPAADQFTYYCCILGLLSAIVYYIKFMCSEGFQSTMSLIYMGLSVLLIAFYIGHWFVKPNLEYPKAENQNYECIDKRKCSHPLHLVLQAAFMFFVTLSLVSSFFEAH